MLAESLDKEISRTVKAEARERTLELGLRDSGSSVRHDWKRSRIGVKCGRKGKREREK